MRTARKVNFMVDEEIREEFERLVPAGERSRTVNRALRRELSILRRQQLSEKLLQLRAQTDPIPPGEIVKAVRTVRKRGR
jgi:hypothetical protein